MPLTCRSTGLYDKKDDLLVLQHAITRAWPQYVLCLPFLADTFLALSFRIPCILDIRSAIASRVTSSCPFASFTTYFPSHLPSLTSLAPPVAVPFHVHLGIPSTCSPRWAIVVRSGHIHTNSRFRHSLYIALSSLCARSTPTMQEMGEKTPGSICTTPSPAVQLSISVAGRLSTLSGCKFSGSCARPLPLFAYACCAQVVLSRNISAHNL